MEAMSTMRDRPYVPGQELQAQESFHIRSLGVAAKNSLDLAGEGMEPTGENGLKSRPERRLITSKSNEHGPSSHDTQQYAQSPNLMRREKLGKVCRHVG